MRVSGREVVAYSMTHLSIGVICPTVRTSIPLSGIVKLRIYSYLKKKLPNQDDFTEIVAAKEELA